MLGNSANTRKAQRSFHPFGVSNSSNPSSLVKTPSSIRLVNDTLVEDGCLSRVTVLNTIPADLTLLVKGGLLVSHDESGNNLLRVSDLALADAHVISHNPQHRRRASDRWVEESTLLDLDWQWLLRLVVELVERG